MRSLFQPPTEIDTLYQLFNLGYFQGAEWDTVKNFVLGATPKAQQAIEEYREFHGLTPSENTATHMLFPRCGVPDFARPQEAGLCKWPMLNVTTANRIEGLNPLSAEREQAAWLEALAAWNTVCGIQLSLIPGMDTANIYANPGVTGAGVLAYSYLPCGATSTSQMQQVYNSATNWSYALLVNVLIHEIGHAIGLDHGPRGSIMQPTAAGDITRPQTWDIEQAVARYGLPGPVPPTPETPNEGVSDIIVTRTLLPGRYSLTTRNGVGNDDLVML